MNIQDPISDLITQIRNAYLAKKEYIVVFSSKIKISILDILKKEFFINDYTIINDKNNIKKVKIILKYYGKKIPMIKNIRRISKPSLRIYKKNKDLKILTNKFGISIISTTKGVMSNKEAKNKNIGGEVLCIVE